MGMGYRTQSSSAARYIDVRKKRRGLAEDGTDEPARGGAPCAPVHNNRHLVLERLRRFEEARCESALKIKPDYGAAADNRRLVLEEIERSRQPR